MTQLVIIVAYLCLLLLLGLAASLLFRGTSKDYLLASHSIGPFLLLMSLFGTTMTAFALVGSSGEAFKEGIGVYGMLASSSGIIHSLCFFVLGIKLWSWGHRFGYTTQIQFFRDRLQNDGIGLLLFPIIVGLVIPYLLIGVISSGIVIQSMTGGAFPELFPTSNPGTNGGVPPWIGSLVICCIVLTYVFFGGMRGTAWANAFQTIVFMVLGIVAFYAIAMKLGGQPSFLENLRVCSDAVSHEKITRIDMSKTKFLTYLLIPLSVGMFPHLFQHWLTAKSASSFKLSIVAHPVFIMIVWVPCVLIGIWATTSLVPTKPPLPKISGTDIINANAVLPFLVKTQTSAVLGGFLTAGILAAIMSSLDSQFLCLGTIFTGDIVGHYVGNDRLTDRKKIWLARGFITAIVAVTYGLSLLPQRSVFGMGVWCFSGFASLFPLVLAAVYWKRLTAAGAYASILTTLVTWLVLFRQSGFGQDRGFTVDIPVGGVTYETMPVLTIFLASAVALVAVSLVTRPPHEQTLARFFGAK
jgi:SSS family solute:Na+ symporter